MHTRLRISSIFNLAMVDVLCCALGCVILLWLLVREVGRLYGRDLDRIAWLAAAIFAVHPLFSHMMPTCGKAYRKHEPALLRIVEALVERLLRLSQAPQCVGPLGQRVGVVAQALDRVGSLSNVLYTRPGARA